VCLVLKHLLATILQATTTTIAKFVFFLTLLGSFMDERCLFFAAHFIATKTDDNNHIENQTGLLFQNETCIRKKMQFLTWNTQVGCLDTPISF
jgi:hypothetical protein